MSFVILAWSAASGHISGPKRPFPIKTMHKITFHVYLHRLRAAGGKSLSSNNNDVYATERGPFRGFNGSQCNIGRDIVKRGRCCGSRLYFQSISKTAAMVIEGSRGGCLVFWRSREDFQILSLAAVIFPDGWSWIDLFCFPIPSTWELSMALLGLPHLVLIWLYTYKVSNAFDPLSQVWRTMCPFLVSRYWQRNVIRVNRFIFTRITLLALSSSPLFILTIIKTLALCWQYLTEKTYC